MRIVVRMWPIRAADVGMNLIHALAMIMPSAVAKETFWLRDPVPVSDPLVSVLISTLQQAGLRRWQPGDGRLDKSKHFHLEYFREYDESDLESCEYMTFHAPWAVDTIDRDELGRLGITCPTSSVAPDAPFAWTLEDTIAVRDRPKRLLESAELLNVGFHETFCDDQRDGFVRHISWDEFDEGERWWEMTSNLILPPVSPVMIIRDRHGNRVEPGYDKMCSLHDLECPDCMDVELHYRRQDLRKVEPFDLALSFEGRPGRFYVVSKRFYNVCKQHNLHDVCKDHHLRKQWVPLRIDDESNVNDASAKA